MVCLPGVEVNALTAMQTANGSQVVEAWVAQEGPWAHHHLGATCTSECVLLGVLLASA